MNELTSPPPTIDRDILIEQNRSYVRALAVRVMRSLSVQVDLEELTSFGTLGLVEAAERFDPKRGVAFSTFAHYRIKGAIYDGLREMGYYSHSAKSRARWAANANDILQSAADDRYASQDSTIPSVEDEINSIKAVIDELIPAYLLSFSDDNIPDVEDKNAISAEVLERNEMIEFVLKLVAELSKDEQELINALYFKHISMTQLAAKMGITKSWISRLHSRAIRHLRDKLKQHGIITDDRN